MGVAVQLLVSNSFNQLIGEQGKEATARLWTVNFPNVASVLTENSDIREHSVPLSVNQLLTILAGSCNIFIGRLRLPEIDCELKQKLEALAYSKKWKICFDAVQKDLLGTIVVGTCDCWHFVPIFYLKEAASE